LFRASFFLNQRETLSIGTIDETGTQTKEKSDKNNVKLPGAQKGKQKTKEEARKTPVGTAHV
jgi:hypothetical protein